jgi:hypothetical protein
MTLADGTQLSTLADGRSFVLGLPEAIQTHARWQGVADLLVRAAERADYIHDATVRMEEALFFEGRLRVE